MLVRFEENEKLVLTPFEKNLDIWRQLWRVLERINLIVMVVDGRDPLFYRCHDLEIISRKFYIKDDIFWKYWNRFQIIGGDLHYFRVLPEYWEDRLLRAKALGLNTIQVYVPWNLHKPKHGKMVFEGIDDLLSFLKLCEKLDFLVMLRDGPYISGGLFKFLILLIPMFLPYDVLIHVPTSDTKWDLGRFPAWFLAVRPRLQLRTSDISYLK